MKSYYSKKQKAVLWIVFSIFLLYGITLIYPFVWAFLNSVKDMNDYTYNVNGLPDKWIFSNYSEAFKVLKIGSVNFVEMFGNSIGYTVLSTFMCVCSSTVAAYTTAKYNFKLKTFFYGLAVFSMVIPIVGSLPSQYRLVKTILKFDNIIGMSIVNSNGFGYNFIMLYAFFKAISWEYAEAALIDGASDFTIFTHIMLPQAKPALVAIFITSAIGTWNDYMTPLIFLGQKTPLLSYALYDMKLTIGDTKTTIFLAGNLLATLPMILIFSIFSNTIMENTVAGGLKG